MKKTFHPFRLARLLRTVDRAADTLGFFNQPLQPDALIRIAQKHTGLSDLGNWSVQEPLAVLLKAYREEAALTALGRMAARWDMVRFLSNLLRLRAEEKSDPSILDEEIRQPIFILGLPRSGTTFLHNLLAQDPANLAPRCWQTIYPYPVKPRRRTKRDARPRMVARQFASLLWIAPELPSLHPLEANGAQECIEITGQVMRSLRFDTTHYVPSYERWLETAGHREAYRFHKCFLQHLQHQNGNGQWVLKSPDHIYAMNAIFETYPDARFVFVHRDPMEVLPSVARLTEILREPFTRRVDRLQIGRQVADRWVLGARLLIETSLTLRSSPSRLLHVRYRNLIRDPFAIVRELYGQFGLTLAPEAETRIKLFVAQRPRGGYGVNAYRFEDYGLDPEVEQRRYRDYMSFFRIASESVADLIPRRLMYRTAEKGASCS
jgi:Sulfotransferase family